MIVTFCGHSHISDTDRIKIWLNNVVEQFLYEENIIFYFGGYGDFDRLAASVVRQKKNENPHLQAVLVIPYLHRKYNDTDYDYTLYPPLESVPPRYAIVKRNEWMVAQADVIVAYVTHGCGGAAKTLKYAQTKKKSILMCPEI